MTGEFQTIRERMEEILIEKFDPQAISIIDDSHKHVGHAGHDGKGNSHFRIEMTAKVFSGMTRLSVHRMIYDALSNFIPPVHALQISAKSTDTTKG